jgi:HSP20 family molecular chaperone IbpA
MRPRSVDAGKVTADVTKGVLTMYMPKTTENKSKGRKIEIAVTK